MTGGQALKMLLLAMTLTASAFLVDAETPSVTEPTTQAGTDDSESASDIAHLIPIIGGAVGGGVLLLVLALLLYRRRLVKLADRKALARVCIEPRASTLELISGPMSRSESLTNLPGLTADGHAADTSLRPNGGEIHDTVAEGRNKSRGMASPNSTITTLTFGHRCASHEGSVAQAKSPHQKKASASGVACDNQHAPQQAGAAPVPGTFKLDTSKQSTQTVQQGLLAPKAGRERSISTASDGYLAVDREGVDDFSSSFDDRNTAALRSSPQGQLSRSQNQHSSAGSQR